MKSTSAKPNLELIECQLCGKEPTKEISHIIPRLISKTIHRECGALKFRGTENPDKVVQDTLKLPFLGESCEDDFEKLETLLAPVFRKHLKEENSEIQITESIYRALLSISWRVAKYLSLTSPPSKSNHLREPEKYWRDYLLGERADVGDYSQYLFLVADITDTDIRTSEALTRTHLRYSVGFGVNGFYGDGNDFIRQATFVKLGPLILCGHMRDLASDSSPEAKLWEDYLIQPNTIVSRKFKHLPRSVIDGIDAHSHWTTQRLESMSDAQKLKQKNYAKKTLSSTVANNYILQDQKIFKTTDDK